MPTKPTKTTKKSDLKTSKISEKKSSSKTVVNTTTEKKDSTKKIIIKRRKVDLVPTKASAVAIVAQANRAKKQALINKVASADISYNKSENSSDTKIPLWVWTFFGISLLIFCISFYQAKIRPQLENEILNDTQNTELVTNGEESESAGNDAEVINNSETIIENSNNNINTNIGVQVPATPKNVIESYFNYLSNRQFDEAFGLFTASLLRSPEIQQHFTSYRMNAFLDGIEGGKLTPSNITYINSPKYGKDKYSFEIHYTMASNQDKYDETREFVVDTTGDEPKISSIVCTTKKCSYHPIFWPENFGLIK